MTKNNFTALGVSSFATNPDWLKVADNTVVTRKSNGEPASLFHEDAWNVEAYGQNTALKNLHFRRATLKNLSDAVAWSSLYQFKQVMYFLMHETRDTVPAIDTLKKASITLHKFLGFAAKGGRTLYEAMESHELVTAFIKQDGHERSSQRLHAIFVQLHMLGHDRTGVDIPLKQIHDPMLARFRQGGPSLQHPPIPTRIYNHLISRCEVELRQAEDVLPELLSCLRSAYANEPFSQDVSQKLKHLFEFYGRTPSVPGLQAAIQDILFVCKIIILTFAGMRNKEANDLPYACVTPFQQDSVEHWVLEGTTTKLHGGRSKRTCWVTSRLAVRAVRFAQAISGEAHARFSNGDFASSTNGEFLLFARSGLGNSVYERGRGISESTEYMDRFRERNCLAINAEDIKELKFIDPKRAWDDEPDFAVGMPWPFTRHQLRRSLALYAQRSGLVTLPSLKRQLQHITAEMTRYYSRGSSFAKDIVKGNKDHFANEWADTRGTSDYLAYASQVLFSDETLFGGHIAWVKSTAVQQSPVSIYSREEAISMFERGQLAYKETAIGGCASTEECKTSPINWLPLACLEDDCRNLVGSPTKLRRVTRAQEFRVSALSKTPETVEYRIEAETLRVLRKAEERHCPQDGAKQ